MSGSAATLLIAVVGATQSWGVRSHYEVRDTQLEPSKSGMVGLIAAASGRRRHHNVDDLLGLRMGVRIDAPGVVRRDFQTASNVISANTVKVYRTVPTYRHYLADAAFLVGSRCRKVGSVVRDAAHDFIPHNKEIVERSAASKCLA